VAQHVPKLEKLPRQDSMGAVDFEAVPRFMSE